MIILFQWRDINSPFVRLNWGLVIDVRPIKAPVSQNTHQIVKPFAKQRWHRGHSLWLIKSSFRNFGVIFSGVLEKNICPFIPAYFGKGHKDWSLSQHTLVDRQGYTLDSLPLCYRSTVTHSKSHLCVFGLFVRQTNQSEVCTWGSKLKLWWALLIFFIHFDVELLIDESITCHISW